MQRMSNWHPVWLYVDSCLVLLGSTVHILPLNLSSVLTGLFVRSCVSK